MGRRQFMNLLTFGSATGVALGALYPVVRYFIPPSSGGVGGSIPAQDAQGKPVVASEFLATHNVGDRVLAQGLKGDPTYLIVDGPDTIRNYGLNAVCTHLGCVVPWQASENKFICPGVIEPQSNYIEHPELVAQRLERWADVVEPDRLLAGVDCGFSVHVGTTTIDPDVAFAKLASLAQGAELAAKRLFR